MNNNEKKTVVVSSVSDLEKEQQQSYSEFHIYLNNLFIQNESLTELKNDMLQYKGDLSIFFHINDQGKDMVIKANNIKAPKDEHLGKAFINKYKFINNIKII